MRRRIVCAMSARGGQRGVVGRRVIFLRAQHTRVVAACRAAFTAFVFSRRPQCRCHLKKEKKKGKRKKGKGEKGWKHLRRLKGEKAVEVHCPFFLYRQKEGTER